MIVLDKIHLEYTVDRTYQCMVCGGMFPEKCDHICNAYCCYPRQESVMRLGTQVAWRLKEFIRFSSDPLDCCLHWEDNVTKHKYELVRI